MRGTRILVGAVALGSIAIAGSAVSSVLEPPGTAYAGAVALVDSETWVRFMAPEASTVALPGGTPVSIVCEDTFPTDVWFCSLDLYTIEGEKIAWANTSGSAERVGILTAFIPPQNTDGQLLSLFYALPGVSHKWGTAWEPTIVTVVGG